MSRKPNERISSVLPESEIRRMLLALPGALGEILGNETIEASYGWGANLHIDLCWTAMEVNISWLDRFIDDSLRQEIIIPGDSDFTFTIRGGALEIELCHEAHLHVSGTDSSLVDRFSKHPAYLVAMHVDQPHGA